MTLAFVHAACAREATAELLVNRARTMIFSTALPPPAVGAALRAVRLLHEQPELVDRLRARALALRAALRAQGLEVELNTIPIVPLIVGEPDAAVAASDCALRDGVFVQAIRPPTVPPGSSRLRAVATAAHSDDDLARAATCLARAVRQEALAGSG